MVSPLTSSGILCYPLFCCGYPPPSPQMPPSLSHKILLFMAVIFLGHLFPKETFPGSGQETLNSTKLFLKTNLFMLFLNSKSCGVYIIVFKISLAMLFYRFLKNNLYNPCFFLCGLFFIWKWGIFLCLMSSCSPLWPCRATLCIRHMWTLFPMLHVLIFIFNSFNELNLFYQWNSQYELSPVPFGAVIIPAWFRLRRHAPCLGLPAEPHHYPSSPAWSKPKKRWSFGELTFKLIKYWSPLTNESLPFSKSRPEAGQWCTTPLYFAGQSICPGWSSWLAQNTCRRNRWASSAKTSLLFS